MITKEELNQLLLDPCKGLLYFKDKEFLKTNPLVSPHMYIILPTINKEEFIVLVLITSSKHKIIYNDDISKNSVISLQANEYSFITKDCYIDCNRINIFQKDDLLSDKSVRVLRENIPIEFYKNILDKVSKSKFVRTNLKKNLIRM